MGLIRKGVKISTLGLAPIHYRDKQERIVKANERELGVQREILNEQRAAHAAPARAQATATPQADELEQLERLGRLREQGVLTEEEFRAKKAEVLHPTPGALWKRDWRR